MVSQYESHGMDASMQLVQVAPGWGFKSVAEQQYWVDHGYDAWVDKYYKPPGSSYSAPSSGPGGDRGTMSFSSSSAQVAAAKKLRAQGYSVFMSRSGSSYTLKWRAPGATASKPTVDWGMIQSTTPPASGKTSVTKPKQVSPGIAFAQEKFHSVIPKVKQLKQIIRSDLSSEQKREQVTDILKPAIKPAITAIPWSCRRRMFCLYSLTLFCRLLADSNA